MKSTTLTALALAAVLAACSSTPPPPDWQMNARGALDAFTHAYMTGNARVEAAEFARARSALTATGQPELVARAELLRCAAQVASLVLQRCDGFEPLRQDAPAAERAYAAWLAGQAQPQDVALLPAAQRAAMADGADAVKAIADPLSRLVAAGVLMRMGRATPDVIALAVHTASAQGWRRPLLAWLGVQAQRAEGAGAIEEAARIRRRMALVAP
jgi:hypothetical protein